MICSLFSLFGSILKGSMFSSAVGTTVRLTDKRDLLAVRQTDRQSDRQADRSRTMKAGRDEPLLFLTGRQTDSRSSKTKPDRNKVWVRSLIRSGPVHFIPPFCFQHPTPSTYSPLPRRFTAAEGGVSQPISGSREADSSTEN